MAQTSQHGEVECFLSRLSTVKRSKFPNNVQQTHWEIPWK